jgi:hypothetical protein
MITLRSLEAILSIVRRTSCIAGLFVRSNPVSTGFFSGGLADVAGRFIIFLVMASSTVNLLLHLVL